MVVEAVKELLFKYNCVIIPGFGGVITHASSAQIHPIKNTFTPPSKRLAFNENLKESDGLLINHLVQKNSISEQEAFQTIKIFVENTIARIEQEGSAKLADIGVFSFNSEKRLQFKAETTDNLLEDSFGLPELHFKPITRTETRTTMEKTPIQSSPTPPPRGPRKKKEQEEEKKGNPIFLIIPIILIVLTIGSLFIVEDQEGDILMATVFPSLKNSDGELDETTETESSDELAQEDGMSDSSTNTESEDSWGAGTESSADAGSSEWGSSNQNGTFHIIAGVFSKKRFANRLANKHNGEVLEIDGYYKVSVGRFDTKSAADAEKANLTSELGSGIWILAQ